MSEMMKTIVATAIAVALISGCVTPNGDRGAATFGVTDGSKADGYVELSFQRTLAQNSPTQKQIDEGLARAKKACAGWGYSDSSRFDGLSRRTTGQGLGITHWMYMRIQCID